MVAPFRLVCAIDSLTGGGAEKVLTALTARLDPTQFEIQIVLTLDTVNRQSVAPTIGLVPLTRRPPARLDRARLAWPDRLFDHLLAAGFRTFAGEKPADHHGSAIAQQHLQQLVRTLRLASARFGRHLRAWEPDCVLSFLPYSNLIALLAQQWYRWPGALVLSDRNYLSRELAGLPWPMLHARFIRAYYGRAARHVCVSNAAAVDLRASFGVASERIVTIANGVDGADLAARAADALPDSAPIRTPEHLWLVAVGRLQAQKGFDILLAALAQPRASRWQLLLLGTGPDETALRTQARQLGLATRIHFLGWDANPYRWLGRADAYVLSSRWEGMPNALLEALALGRPVIATDCQSGPREILDGGCYGRLVPPEAVEPLAEALGDFADDANVRAHYSALALERSQRYCINRMVTEYARLLEQVIGERRGAGELP